MLIEKHLRQILGKRIVRRLHCPERVRSAVLVPLFRQDEEWHVLFIRRTQDVKHHKGQIAFPGGAYQPEDGTILNTALRESTEEIGLQREDVAILGELDDFITTTSNFVISPFVACVPWPYCFLLNNKETETIITAPLAAFQDKANISLEDETIGGQRVPSLNYHYRGSVIWGATARILAQLLEIFEEQKIGSV